MASVSRRYDMISPPLCSCVGANVRVSEASEGPGSKTRKKLRVRARAAHHHSAQEGEEMLHVDAGRYARIFALSTAALAFAARAATFETAAKVWFPPYGSQRDYTTRARSYGTDLKRF